MSRDNRFSGWSTPGLVSEFAVLQRRCWNGEGANVYPLLKAAQEELLSRGVIPAQIASRMLGRGGAATG